MVTPLRSRPATTSRLDRPNGRRAGSAGAVPGAAAGPGAGLGSRPPRHAHDPQQHRGLDRRDGQRAGRRWNSSRRCCRTSSGFWAATTTPLRSRPATTSCWTGEAGDAAAGLICSRRCCRSRSGFWAATTPTHSKLSDCLGSGQSGVATVRRDATCCAKDYACRNTIRHQSSVGTEFAQCDPRPQVRRSGASGVRHARSPLIARPTATRPR